MKLKGRSTRGGAHALVILKILSDCVDILPGMIPDPSV